MICRSCVLGDHTACTDCPCQHRPAPAPITVEVVGPVEVDPVVEDGE